VEKKTKKAGKCGRLFPTISPFPISPLLHTENKVAKRGRWTGSCSPSQMCDV